MIKCHHKRESKAWSKRNHFIKWYTSQNNKVYEEIQKNSFESFIFSGKYIILGITQKIIEIFLYHHSFN